MNITHTKLIDDLNEKQKNAVTTDSQHTLVLAGAGSGKTRVLVHRIAWLCLEKSYRSSSIFAVTFTNKAAAEMQERILEIVGEAYFNGMWIGTFHGLSHKLLRIFHQQAGLSPHFQLIDSEDQHRLVKRVFKELNIDEKKWSTKECANFISTQKELGIRANQIAITDPQAELWQKIYEQYQSICERMGYVDFSELILRTYELLKNNAQVLNYCHQRFANILVDEFQDTNHIQFELVKLLAGDSSNVMIVGDDDQSIYSWRGANADNLQHFINDFPHTELIRLEQNYRSQNIILEAANALIKNNQQRLGKNLWTDQQKGELINLYVGFNDIEEARFVISKIKKIHQNGFAYKKCAILYRNNVQARLFEDALLQSSLPYQIYGSIRFYERQEVKLALAYLRLLHQRDNDHAFEWVVNTPTRGIGETTLNKLRLHAKQKGLSLWQASIDAINSKILTGRQITGLIRFIELMQSIYDAVHAMPFYEQLQNLIQSSGIKAMYEQEPGIKGQSRLEHLDELVIAAEQFYVSNQDKQVEQNPFIDEQNADSEPKNSATLSVLEQFLSVTSLEGTESKKTQDAVQLMTLHAAKGLEFDFVFIVGLEEGLFPAQRSIADEQKLEEERRLAYVGITRAKKQLTLSLCQQRRLYGKTERAFPSLFINEIPKHLINDLSYQTEFSSTQRQNYSQSDYFYNDKPAFTKKTKPLADKNDPYQLGKKVTHARFGIGTIINTDGEGDKRRVQIAFINEGVKWLVIKLANLTFN